MYHVSGLLGRETPETRKPVNKFTPRRKFPKVCFHELVLYCCAGVLEDFDIKQVRSAGAGISSVIAQQMSDEEESKKRIAKTEESKLKFDPLRSHTRRGDLSNTRTGREESKKEVDTELDLANLMEELLTDSGRDHDFPASMKDTLNALSGMSGDPSSAEDDSISSNLVDSIMRQLLSKEVLYQPLKDIGERYPPWLEAHATALSVEEHTQYQKQYEFIKKICHVYEAEPDNFGKLMSLLQEMQECGQPPQEIINELSPAGESPLLPGFTGTANQPSECAVM
jgi:hypothetical protein